MNDLLHNLPNQRQCLLSEAIKYYWSVLFMFSFFVWIDIRKKVYWKGILVRELTDKQKTIFLMLM